MRKAALSIAAVAVIAASVPATAASPESASVKVRDDFFKPKAVTIKKGGKVTWRWRGSDNPHNVAIKKPGETKVFRRSAVKTSSGKYSYTFKRTGTWRVLCEIHPRDMKMRVVVKAS